MPVDDLPYLPEPLIDFLQEAFPNRLPETDEEATPVAVARKRGQQDVIRKIGEIVQYQTAEQED